MRTDKQTDMTKLIVAFRNFGNATNNAARRKGVITERCNTDQRIDPVYILSFKMAEHVAQLLPSIRLYIHCQQNEREPETADDVNNYAALLPNITFTLHCWHDLNA